MRAHPRFLNRFQRTGLLILLLITFVLFSISQLSPATVRASNSSYSVTIADYSFTPAHINITTGTTVTWNYPSGSSYHTVTSDPQTNLTQSGTPLISSGTLNPGQSFSYTFNLPGYYPYQCGFHPALMNGWVKVAGNPITNNSGSSVTSSPWLLISGATIAAIAGVSVAWFLLRGRHRVRSGELSATK